MAAAGTHPRGSRPVGPKTNVFLFVPLCFGPFSRYVGKRKMRDGEKEEEKKEKVKKEGREEKEAEVEDNY